MKASVNCFFTMKYDWIAAYNLPRTTIKVVMIMLETLTKK